MKISKENIKIKKSKFQKKNLKQINWKSGENSEEKKQMNQNFENQPMKICQKFRKK